jgi:hypothetical protein
MTIEAGAQDASPVTPGPARAEFDANATYWGTATFGQPPRRSRTGHQQALAQRQSAEGQVADLDALTSEVPGTAKARRWHGAS